MKSTSNTDHSECSQDLENEGARDIREDTDTHASARGASIERQAGEARGHGTE